MITRIFETAVEPDDVEPGKELFKRDVRPVFEKFEGCAGIDLYIGLDEHSADLVNFMVVTRWESRDAIERAIATEEYRDALAGLRHLFHQTPIVRHFERVD